MFSLMTWENWLGWPVQSLLTVNYDFGSSSFMSSRKLTSLSPSYLWLFLSLNELWCDFPDKTRNEVKRALANWTRSSSHLPIEPGTKRAALQTPVTLSSIHPDYTRPFALTQFPFYHSSTSNLSILPVGYCFNSKYSRLTERPSLSPSPTTPALTYLCSQVPTAVSS